MSRSKDPIYPPYEILNPPPGKNPNFEYIILWMLNNNESCKWSDFKKKIKESTLSGYLDKLKKQGFVKHSYNNYEITSNGKTRFNELLYQEEVKIKLNYPPKKITHERNYDDIILWMLNNNNSLTWSDFRNEPLKINSSSLSKSLTSLKQDDYVKKEDDTYIITSKGRVNYFDMLKNYDLDRQSILEEESKRIQDFTKYTNNFFDKFGIEDDNIKFRFLNNVLKINYSKVESLLEEEEDFNKILLFLSINHPDQHPDYISPERFAHEYNLKKTTLDFFIEKIVDEEFYDIKFFKLEAYPNKEYYFQANEKIERLFKYVNLVI